MVIPRIILLIRLLLLLRILLHIIIVLFRLFHLAILLPLRLFLSSTKHVAIVSVQGTAGAQHLATRQQLTQQVA